MFIYLRNPQTQEVVSGEDTSFGAMYDSWVILTEQEVVDYLEEYQIVIDTASINRIKLDMINTLKSNRELANAKFVTAEALEIIFDEEESEFITTENLVNFKFKLNPTGYSQTAPAAICLGVIVRGTANLAYFARYSCEIFDGEGLRKGYVRLDKDVAEFVVDTSSTRTINNTSTCNMVENQINSIVIIEDEENPENNFTYAQCLEALSLINLNPFE